MSDRLDVVIIEEAQVRIYHQKWGATALFDTLLGGPASAVDLATTFPETAQLDDILAGCVIDLERRVLIIAGADDVISASKGTHTYGPDVLPELAGAWPGWHLEYEPFCVIDPVVGYVRGRGLALRSLNEPRSGENAFVETMFKLDAPLEPQRPVPFPQRWETSTRSLALLELSARAENELRNAELHTFGDLAGLDDAALASRGLSRKARKELSEALEGQEG